MKKETFMLSMRYKRALKRNIKGKEKNFVKPDERKWEKGTINPPPSKNGKTGKKRKLKRNPNILT